MEHGFIVDEGYGKKLVRSGSRASREELLGGPELAARTVEVATYRCRSCGYLESYA